MKEFKKARTGIIAVLALVVVSITRRLMGTRRLSSGMMALVVAGMALVVAAGGASAATAITECQEITEPGEYYLANDIDNSTADVCIYIKADDVTLDGQGHYINGVTPGTCQEIIDFPGQKATCFARPGIAVKGQKNVIIRNVEVKNFCTGILLHGTSLHDEYHTIENCIVRDNGNPNVDIGTANFHGIALYKKVCYSTISNNEVYSNTGKLAGDCDDNGAGISLRVYCNYNNVMNNDIHHNTLAGIYSKAGGGNCYNTFSSNTVYENGATGSLADFTGGIRFQCKSTDDNTIANNIVSDNFGPGIFVGGNDCIVSGNTVTGNKDANDGANSRGDGLRINRYGDGGGRNTQIDGNHFCDNEHLDINVHTPDVGVAGTTGDDNTCDTTSNYDDAGTTGCTNPCTPIEISECQEITEPGEYYLANDIDNSTVDVCIYIKADDVTLDGKGYCIDGGTTGTCVQLDDFPSSMSGYARAGIAVKRKSNVALKNVEVKNFCNGILLYGPSENNTVANCIVHDNGDPDVDVGTADSHGIALYNRVCNSTVMENVVYNSTGMLTGSCEDSGAGIILKVRCNHNEVRENTVYNNTLAGIYSKAGGGDCFNKISRNTVYQNGEIGSDACFTGGIRFQCKSTDDNIIEYNTVRDNFGPGIFIGGNDCTVRNNTATWNKDAKNSPNSRGDGLRVDRYGDGGGKNTQIYENTFCNNEHLDINVENTAQNVVGDDNTCDTCSNYNDYGETCCSYGCSEDVGCVAADGTVFGCGDTVTKSCVFNGDLNCEAGHGLVIGAENITIDGDSYMLDGLNPGACDSFGVKRSGIYNKGYDGVLIRNLEIKNFCNGIYLTRDGGDYVYGNTIENCEIHHNGNNISSWSETHGIKMVYVFDSTIRNNSIHDQIAYQNPNPGCEDGGNGLFQYQGTCNNITENRFYNNAKAGILIKMKPTHGNISHNHLWGNGQGGIILRCMLCNFNTIEYNNASGNCGSGIFIGGNNNTIGYNTVCNNRDSGPYYEDSVGGHGYGIHIGRGDGSCNNTLTSNTVCGNDYLDMRVVTGVTGNTGSENTCNTTYNYNDDGTTGCTYSCGVRALKGDLNGDDTITPADAMIALEMGARGEYSENADVNRDQRVTSLDALLILQAAGV